MRGPLTSVDAAWLRMDDATNLMVVTGVLVLDAPVSFDQVRAWLERRVRTLPRFTDRVVDPPGGVGVPSWEPDPQFSVENHLFQLELPPPGDERALQALVSRLMSQPLNTAQPLWRFYLVPRFQGGSALIGRVHHCIGDGLALVHVMLSLADGGPGPAPPPAGDTSSGSFWDTLAESIAGSADLAALPAAVMKEAQALLGDPERISETAGRLAAGLGALGKLLLLPPDPPTALKGPLGAEKRVAWSAPVPLADLKRVGQVTGSTVNDVMTSALAGALRRYLLSRGEVPAALDVRAIVPVNLRPAEEAHRLGNHFGLVFLSLPVGMADPLDRLFEVRRRMKAIKDTPEALVAFQILRALGLAPKPLFDVVVDQFGAKGTAVVTNVAGPTVPVSMMGVQVRRTMFWVPSAGRLGTGISLLSYAGAVSMGVQVDAGLVPDPERIVESFEGEVAVLLELERAAGR
jgi:WS/DGAT/MGAT family acyltransferase